MYSRFTTACLVVSVVVLALIGCGKGSDVTGPPTTPLNHDADIAATQHMNWGIWDISIDPETAEAEVIPDRTAEFNASVVRFLQPPICPVELVTVRVNVFESDIPNGLVTMDVGLRHPFPGMNQYRGFDVRGIVMSVADNTGKYDPSTRYYLPGQTELLNADGYTRWWNQAEFTSVETIFGYTEGHFAHGGFESNSTLNPFKVFAIGLEPTQPFYQLDWSTRCTFPVVEGTITRNYRMQFDPVGEPLFSFKYSVDASWSLPDPAYDPEYPIEAYDSMANCQEAYYVAVEEFTEIPYYVDEWVGGGNLDFLLTIGDWQATDGNVLDEISHVWIESPTLFDDPIDVRDTMEFIESTHGTQATYRIYLEDMMPADLKGQQLLITVESAWPDSFEPQIGGSGAAFDYPDSPLAAYEVVDVPITNLTPQGDYAYVYFLPDWCATMRSQCADDSENQLLIYNILRQNIEGYYNDFTHVQIWEGRSHTGYQSAESFIETCDSLGFSVARTTNTYFDAGESRAIVCVLWNMSGSPLDPPLTQEEATDMQEFIENGGILFFMCEATRYFNIQGMQEFFEWLGMLMEYGGGATPEMTDGYTSNITWHWLTDGMQQYHYYTCGEWITQDPHVLTLVATEYDEKAVLMYPLPLE